MEKEEMKKMYATLIDLRRKDPITVCKSNSSGQKGTEKAVLLKPVKRQIHYDNGYLRVYNNLTPIPDIRSAIITAEHEVT